MNEHTLFKLLKALSADTTEDTSQRAPFDLEEEMNKAGVLDESKCILRAGFVLDAGVPTREYMADVVSHLAFSHENLAAAALLLAFVEYNAVLAEATNTFAVRSGNTEHIDVGATALEGHKQAIEHARTLYNRLKAKQDLADEVANQTAGAAEADIG